MSASDDLRTMLYDIQSASSLKSKADALSSLWEYLDEDAQMRLTRDTYDAFDHRCNTSGDIITWVAVIKTCIRAVNTKSSATFSVSRLAMFSSLKSIIAASESHGHFLCSPGFLNVLLCLIVAWLEEYFPNKAQSRLLVPIAEIVKIIIEPIEYQTEISEKYYTDLFRLFSKPLLSLCKSKETLTCQLHPYELEFGRLQPKLCNQILNLVVVRYAYDAFPFLEDDVFPFFLQLIENDVRDCSPSGDVLDSLVCALHLHVLSATPPFIRFFSSALPHVSRSLSSCTTPNLRVSIVNLLQVSLDSILALGLADGFVKAHKRTFVDIRVAILRLVAVMDVPENSVYHSCGLSLPLCLNRSWYLLVRLASIFIYICPMEGFCPDSFESLSSETSSRSEEGEQCSKKHKTLQCAWTAVFVCVPVPTSSLWLIFVHLQRFNDSFSLALLDRLIKIFKRDVKQSSLERNSSVLRLIWLMATLRLTLMYRYSRSSVSGPLADPTDVDAILNLVSTVSPRNPSLIAQTSRLFCWLAPLDVALDAKIVSILRLSVPALVDAYSALCMSNIAEVTGRCGLEFVIGRVKLLLQSIVEHDEDISRVDFDCVRVVADNNYHRSIAIIKAIARLCGKGDKFDCGLQSSETTGIVVLPIVDQPSDPALGILDWSEEQFQSVFSNTAVDCDRITNCLSASISHEIDLIFQRFLTQFSSYSTLQRLRLLHVCAFISPNHAAYCAKHLWSETCGFDNISVMEAAAIHHLGAIASCLSNELLVIIQPHVQKRILFLANNVIESRTTIGYSSSVYHESRGHALPVLIKLCEIMAVISPVFEFQNVGTLLLHCHSFRTAFALMSRNHESALTFLDSVTNSENPCAKGNLVAVTLSLSILPTILSGPTPERAVFHYCSFLSRVQSSDEEIQNELPRCARIVVYRVCQSFSSFYDCKRSALFDPQSLIENGCGDLDFIVRRQSGLSAIRTICALQEANSLARSLIINISEYLDESLRDSENPDHGRVLSALRFLVELGSQVPKELCGVVAIMCRFASSFQPAFARGLALNAITQLSLLYDSSVAVLLIEYFESIFHAYIAHCDAPTSEYISCFPWHLFLPDNPQLDLNNLPGDFLNRIVSGLCYGNRNPASQLCTVYMSRYDVDTIRKKTATFVFSRALFQMIRQRIPKISLPDEIFATSSNLLKHLDVQQIVIHTFEGTSVEGPTGLPPESLHAALSALSSQFKFSSIAELLLGNESSGTCLHNLLVSLRIMLKRLLPSHKIKFRSLVDSFINLIQLLPDECLLVSAVLRQIFSTLLWLATDCAQSSVTMPIVSFIFETVYSRSRQLLVPFAMDLASSYLLCDWQTPLHLQDLCPDRGTLLEELRHFSDFCSESALLCQELSNQSRMSRLLRVLQGSESGSELKNISDDVLVRVFHEIPRILSTATLPQQELAGRVIGSFAMFLGRNRFDDIYRNNDDKSKALYDVNYRNRWILSSLCSNLVNNNPEIIFASAVGLEILVGHNSVALLEADWVELLNPFVVTTTVAPPCISEPLPSAWLIPPTNLTFSAWIRTVTASLARSCHDDSLRACLQLVCVSDTFAAQLFPLLVLEMLKQTSRAFHDGNGHRTYGFSESLATLVNAVSKRGSSSKKTYSKILAVVLSTMQLIRQYKAALGLLGPIFDGSKRESSLVPQSLQDILPFQRFETRLNLLSLAKACHSNGRHITAFMLLCIWCEKQTCNSPLGISAVVCGERYQETTDEQLFRSLLTKTSTEFVDKDVFYGASFGDFSDETEHLLHYRQGNWLKILQHCDNLQFSCADVQNDITIQESLRNLQCQSLLKHISGSTSPFVYEAAWNFADWTLDASPSHSSSFQEDVYAVLRDIASGCLSLPNEFILKTSSNLVSDVVCFDEYGESLFNIISQFSVLSLIYHMVHSPSKESLYIHEDQPELIRDIMAVLLRALHPDTYSKYCVQQCQHFIKLQNEPLAASFQYRCRLFGSNDEFALNHQNARLMWSRGQHSRAIMSMMRLVDDPQCIQDDLVAEGNLCLGRWAAHAKSHQYDFVVDRFQRACTHLSVSPDAYFYLASFQDRILHNLLDKETDAEDQFISVLHTKRAAELFRLKQQLDHTRTGQQSDEEVQRLKGYVKSLQLQFNDDEATLQRSQERIATLAQHSVSNYIISMQLGDRHDLQALYRLISIWFNLYQRFSIISQAVLRAVDILDSSKFLPLFPQISSRIQSVADHMSTESLDSDPIMLFHVTVLRLLQRILTRHPQIFMFTLIALCNLDRVSIRNHRMNTAYDMNKDKQQQAKKLLRSLIAESPELEQCISAQMKLSESYIELSSQKWPARQSRIDLQSLALGKLSKSNVLRFVCAPTRGFPTKYSDHYGATLASTNSIVSFDRYARFAPSGINRPVIVSFTCSDGSHHQELVKPNDDLRQDAVMEQVFQLVNSFLAADRNAAQNCLHMRTYNVVPLTPCIGLVQFIKNAVSLGDYLVPAHAKYHCDDWTIDYCRSRVRDTPINNALKVYNTITQHFRPVFHHFLNEYFSYSPESWLRAQVRYSRSVAVSSIVGYIIGLGDRHCQNILIDKDNFTLIHIDLGIAFDQGKLLKKPETVPFRLTRDIVDAMGVTGVEGVFRRSAESVLELLRENQDAILTLIDVFKFDPLYRWSISSEKCKQFQQTCSTPDGEVKTENEPEKSEANNNAVRACLSVKRKLEGREDGDILSVQGQVRKLILDATSSANLAPMFHGWSAWM